MSATTANGNPPDTNAPTPIQKKPHKKRRPSAARLRKLWRRATTNPQGIASRSEWDELMDLHSDWKKEISTATDGRDQERYPDVLPGPSISIRGEPRDFRKIEEWQSSKVSDIRDVLINLLFRGDEKNNDYDSGPSKKKRKKQKSESNENGKGNLFQQKVNVPSLPSWANVANLASISGLAVIEISVNDTTVSEDDKHGSCGLMPSELLQQSDRIWETLLHSNTNSDNKNQVRRVIGSAYKVKIQGDFPRCISDELMFLPPPSSYKLKGPDGKDSGLFEVLHGLRLTTTQLQSEGFPRLLGRQPPDDAEMYTKTKDAKQKIITLSKSFWDNFTAVKDSETKLATQDNPEGTLELVKAVSVRGTVCCSEENKTPIDDEFSKSEFYVKTFECDKERPPKVFALDCEMVQTSAGPELARVSVVMLVPDGNGYNGIKESDETVTTLFDELVKPRRAILDYLTEYSGIRPDMLEDVQTRIEDVQLHLLSLIQENDVIVGHSLENDLKALRLLHINVVDTSMIFRGVNGRKYGLRHLSNVLLKKQIQNSVDGHCSTEDAKAALILATRRAKLGPAFQMKENSRGKNIMRVFQSINRNAGERSGSFAERNKGPCVCIGSNEWLSKYAKSDGSHHALACDSLLNPMSMSVPSWLSSSTSGRRAGLLWANLMTCGGANSKPGRMNEMKKLEEIMRDLVHRVPFHTPILMIFQRSYEQALTLTKQRKIALKSTSIQWTSHQEKEWQNSMESCMNCEAVWLVGSYTG